MKNSLRLAGLAAPLLVVMLCAFAEDTVTDEQLLAYASNDFAHSEMMYKHVDLGVHHGSPVVADFPCADVCPDNTKRIIHYRLEDGQKCASVHGVEIKIQVPTGLGQMEQRFCAPKVLAAKRLAIWPQY